MSDPALHSILPPSSAARNLQCPGSTTFEARYPEDGSGVEAAEGEAAHWVLAERMAELVNDEGFIAPNGVVVTEEMCEAAEDLYEDVAATLARYGLTVAHARCEVRVAIPRVHAQCWGTPDIHVVVQLPNGRFLVIVYDFKFGHGIVEVYENPQLIDYGCGVASTYGLDETKTDMLFKIAQPRAFHREGTIREWRVTLVDLRAHINRRSNAAHEALGENPRTRVGPECKHCRARHACQTLQRAALEAADVAGGVTPLELGPDALGLELATLQRARTMLDNRISGLEEQAIAIFRKGSRVPRFTIERGQSRQTWKQSAAEVLAVADSFSIDLRKPVALVTPKQAIEKGLPGSLVEAFAHRLPAEAKLVPDNNSMMRRIFGQIG